MAQLLGKPHGDGHGIVERRPGRPRQWDAGQQAARPHGPGAQSIARVQAGCGQVNGSEPANRRATPAGEFERIRDCRASGYAVVRMCPVAAAVCLQCEMGVDRVVMDESEVDGHGCSSTAATARFRQAMHHGSRIQQRGRVHREFEAAAADRHPALELVTGQVDASPVQRREHALDTVLPGRSTDVFDCPAGMFQKSGIGRSVGPACVGDPFEESGLPLCEAPTYGCKRLFERKRCAEEPWQRRQEP